MNALALVKRKVVAAQNAVAGRPLLSITVFVAIVVIVSLLGYARYQQVQAELAAQQDIRWQIQRGIDNWTNDLSLRLGHVKEGIEGTARDAGNLVGGIWGIIRFVVTAVFDFVGNLHIMIPVTVIYLGAGFFGAASVRLATLLGAIFAIFMATRAGIVPASILGLCAMFVLLFWNHIDPRLHSLVNSLPHRLKSRVQRLRTSGREANNA